MFATRGHPKPCLPCQAHLEETIGFRAQAVVHADLIPTFVGLRIFAAMPQRVRMQALVAAFKGKGALRSAVIGAVAGAMLPSPYVCQRAPCCFTVAFSVVLLFKWMYRQSEKASITLSRV